MGLEGEKYAIIFKEKYRIDELTPRFFYEHKLNLAMLKTSSFYIGKEEIFLNEELDIIKTALAEARYDKNGNRLDDGTSDIDTIDALEYALKPEIKYILQNYYKG